MEISLVDLKAQYRDIKSEIDNAIARVIADGIFIKGKYVEQFEREWAEYVGVNYCVSCANGTDAIEIGLRAAGIGPGDEVIVPAHTWISTAEAVSSVGAKVVFADVLPDIYTLDTSKLADLINERTKGIIVVHLYGHPVDMDEVMGLVKKHNLFLIEDIAQAHSAQYKGKTVGNFGQLSTYSFFPGKNLGAYGDAGAMVMNDEGLAKTCRMIADHGRLGKHDHGIEGRNSRLDSLQASILSAKLPFLAKWTEARRSHARAYNELLSNSGLQLPVEREYAKHVYHLYVVQVEERERVQQELQKQGIATGVHYPIALPFLKAFARLNHQPADFPVAHRSMSRIMSLPMYAELTSEQLSFVASTLTNSVAKN